jgi:hypothetical protein
MSLFVEVTVSRKTLIGSVRSFLLHCCQEHCKALRYYHHYLSICPGLGNLDCWLSNVLQFCRRCFIHTLTINISCRTLSWFIVTVSTSETSPGFELKTKRFSSCRFSLTVVVGKSYLLVVLLVTRSPSWVWWWSKISSHFYLNILNLLCISSGLLQSISGGLNLSAMLLNKQSLKLEMFTQLVREVWCWTIWLSHSWHHVIVLAYNNYTNCVL